MAGAALAGELGTRFAVATAADDAALRRLLRENAMPGAVSLTFEREPAYFVGAGLAGGEDETIVAYRDERLVCFGRCTRRECWVDGVAREVGYLAELRLDAAARGQFGILRAGYEFFAEWERPAPAHLYFTSIAADNERARRLLERGARGLPRYEFLTELETLLVAVPRRPRAPRLRVERATVAELLCVLNAPRHQLAAVWTEGRLRALAQHGLPLERFLVVRDGGEAVACGALWDQRAFRQTRIRGYAHSIRWMQPLLNAASVLFGTPRLPRVDEVLAQAFLSPLAMAPGAEALLPDFLKAFFPSALQAGAEYLTLALPAHDPRLPLLRRRFTTRTYRSRLYQVAWPDFPAHRVLPSAASGSADILSAPAGILPASLTKGAVPILPDVALL